jgi:hypothetical protein
MAGRATYFRAYRVSARERAHQKSVKEGVELSIKLLRMTVGTATVTGLEAAQMIERTLIRRVSTRFVVRPV